MRGALSGLTTRGRCLLAAGIAAALCSAVLNERDLLRVAVFVVALPMLSAGLAASARVGLSARRHLLPARVPAGDDADVVLEVHAHGRVPSGGLLLEDSVPYTLGGRPRFVVERLRRRGTARLGYRVHPTMRGVHQLGPLRARITDPFGLAEFERELAGQSRVVVVPRTVPLAGLPGGAGTGVGDDGSVRLRSGQGDDDAVVRHYRPAGPARTGAPRPRPDGQPGVGGQLLRQRLPAPAPLRPAGPAGRRGQPGAGRRQPGDRAQRRRAARRPGHAEADPTP